MNPMLQSKMLKRSVLLTLIYIQSSFQSNENLSIEISSLKDCEDEKVVPPEGFTLETEIKDDGNGKKVFNAKVTIPFDIDDTIKYKATIKTKVNKDWIPLKLVLFGTVCDHVNKYLPGLWEKISKAAGISKNCPIKAGTYSVEGVAINISDDVQLPFIPSGEYLISIMVLDKNDKPLTCKQSQLTINIK